MHACDQPKVGVVMGSSSDWEVMKNAVQVLRDKFDSGAGTDQQRGVPGESRKKLVCEADRRICDGDRAAADLCRPVCG